MSPSDDVRALLTPSDDPEAQRRLSALLQAVAHRALRRERSGSLETTDLANEVYLRLAEDVGREIEDLPHLRRLVARVTRNVLVDRARTRNALKRGGDRVRVTWTEADHASDDLRVDVLALHHALEKLRALDPRAAEIVELRVFGGATATEAGDAVGVSRATVQAEWSFALTWLRKALSRGA